MKLMQSILKTKYAIKVTSLIFGFIFWAMLSNNHTTQLTLDVPLCFFGTSTTKDIDAPETITLQLSGKRSDLYRLDREHVALHVDSDELSPGHHLLEITPEKLFLPQTIKLVNWRPLNPVIIITEKNQA